MKKLLETISKAAQDTAAHAEKELRSSALEHGWSKRVVNNMHVRYIGGKFNVYVHDKVADEAFVHEHGDETQRPTAVVHKFNSNPEGAGTAFANSFKKHMGGSR